MDYEDIGNFSNYTFEDDITPESSMDFLVHEIIFVFACLAAIVADGFIIYIIFNFKRMRTVPNIILANWAIADFVSLFFTPSNYRIISVLEFVPLPFELMCIFFQITTTLHVLTIWFASLVTIDWYIAAYFEKTSERIRRYYKFILGGMWMLALLFSSVTSGLCLSDRFIWIQTPMLLFSYCAILLLVIIFQSYRGVQKCRGKFIDYPPLMLTLVTALVLSWFLGFLNVVVMNFTHTYHPSLAIIAACNVFCSSIITFILLYRESKDFQSCFLKVLRRSKDACEEADFDFANPVFNSHNRRPIVKVTFNNIKDVLAP